jgi:hypothetical protein
MTFDEFLASFQNVKQQNGHGQYSANCPCCNDTKGHLYIKHDTTENRVAIYCQKQCSANDILASVGLKMSDLYLSNGNISQSSAPRTPKVHTPVTQSNQQTAETPKETRQFVSKRSHIYTTESGVTWGKKDIATYFYPERGESGESGETDKSCYWHRFKDGKFSMGLDGEKAPPYNLHRLASAPKIYITEGEKDADTLATMGFIATCRQAVQGQTGTRRTTNILQEKTLLLSPTTIKLAKIMVRISPKIS